MGTGGSGGGPEDVAGGRPGERPGAARAVTLRPARRADLLWLLAQGLDPAKVGEQYHVVEAPLQLWIAPARCWLARCSPAAAIVEVDGRRAGYIGPNPLSGNLEYFVRPWARGGTGRVMIRSYLGSYRRDDRRRRFYVSHANERSQRALLGAVASLGWRAGEQFEVVDGRTGWSIWVA